MSALAQSRVLIVGMGGLGCPASLALAKAGAKRFTLADPDEIELSNLHRQLWYTEADLGRRKAEISARRMRTAFPDLTVSALVDRIETHNVERLLLAHDIAIDGTDGVDSKFLLSDASVSTGTPVVYGGVLQLHGQAMLINREGPCLRCLFEDPGPAGLPTCSRAGVMGSVAGVIGTVQGLLAADALMGKGMAGQLWVFDAASLSQRTIEIPKGKDCPVCGEARSRHLYSTGAQA